LLYIETQIPDNGVKKLLVYFLVMENAPITM